jgi:hypothetical protein
MCNNQAMHSVQNIPAGAVERLVMLNEYSRFEKFKPHEIVTIRDKMKAIVSEVMAACPTSEAYGRLAALNLPDDVRQHLERSFRHRPHRTTTRTNQTAFATA